MAGRTVTTAEAMGAAARYDPQLKVPMRPRVRRGLSIRYGDSDVLVYGGPKRQLFQGHSATSLLPRILPELDGKHTRDDLSVRLDLPEDTLFKVLALLWTCGVIEEGPPSVLPTLAVDSAVADFLSRFGDSTGANQSWEEAAVRLQAVRLGVYGPSAESEALCQELRPTIDCAVMGPGTPIGDRNLIVKIVTGADRRPDDVARQCWDNGVTLIQMGLGDRRLELGPMVDPRVTPCLACMTATGVEDGGEPRRSDRVLALSLFARELFALVSRAVPSTLPMRWRTVDLETLAYSDASGATRPGCPDCSVATGPPVDEIPLAVRYEASVALPPREFADLKSHQVHYKASNLALQRQARLWPASRKIDLESPHYDRLQAPWAISPGCQPEMPDSLTLGQLSLLLATSAGLKPGEGDQRKVGRWTASGGNIGSVVAYLVVRDCNGLEPGIYGYLTSTHQLAGLSGNAEGIPGDSPVSIVLTGDFRKVAQKYLGFALRIVLLDSGCAQATIRIVAQMLGVAINSRPDWNDREMAAALRIDGDVEPITAVFDLGGRS
jgi:SagB-type dehydrogenase family enzyme